jgi:hypothetical protein
MEVSSTKIKDGECKPVSIEILKFYINPLKVPHLPFAGIIRSSPYSPR